MTDYVLTLIAGPAWSLTPSRVDEVSGALLRLGADLGRDDWLAPERACDLPFRGLDPDQADAAARRALAGQAIDVVAQPAQGRRKRLLVADMESTLIHNEMLDELADFVGLRDRVAAITARAMNGELDFAGALRARVALLKGLPVEVLETAAARIAYMPGAAELVATMRAHGATTAVVSGGFRIFSALVRQQLGLDLDRANDLVIERRHLAGTVAEPILGRAAKRETLLLLASAAGLALDATLAVGDGANDLDMIQAAGLGIAFHPKPALAAAARWRIDHGDLTALLYAQGYRAGEIVASL